MNSKGWDRPQNEANRPYKWAQPDFPHSAQVQCGAKRTRIKANWQFTLSLMYSFWNGVKGVSDK
jgi:hypothetical protein